MKFLMFILLILPGYSFSAGKKISCELEMYDPNPFRYDEFIFDTDDFKKDFPKATHKVTFAHSKPRSEQLIDYTVTPTHIIFKEYDSYWGIMEHTINRKNLSRDTRWMGRNNKCSISDVAKDDNVF